MGSIDLEVQLNDPSGTRGEGASSLWERGWMGKWLAGSDLLKGFRDVDLLGWVMKMKIVMDVDWRERSGTTQRDVAKQGETEIQV